MGLTSIEWTDRTWSPLRVRVRNDAGRIAKERSYTSLVQIAEKMAGHVGPHCERVSHGCDNCYSDSNNHRCLPSNGTGLPFDRRSRDLVEPFVDERILMEPLKWKKPQRVFVENQSDLFGEWVLDEHIDRVFAVMAVSPRHTFQVLTKRPQRMLEWVLSKRGHLSCEFQVQPAWSASALLPLSNVWLGVSVEDQKTADARIPLLLQTPAAVRFVSYEPILEAVDFTRIKIGAHLVVAMREYATANGLDPDQVEKECAIDDTPWRNCLTGEWFDGWDGGTDTDNKIAWMIAGFESGPGARRAEEGWVRTAKNDCVAAGVAMFYKQRVENGRKISLPELDGRTWAQFPRAAGNR